LKPGALFNILLDKSPRRVTLL